MVGAHGWSCDTREGLGWWRLMAACGATLGVFTLLASAAMARENTWRTWAAQSKGGGSPALIHTLSARHNRRSHSRARAAIVGGTEINIESAPWQAVVFVEKSGQLDYCGGVILNMTHILTAGHCAVGPEGTALPASSFFVGAGTSNALVPSETAEKRLVQSVRVHPYFRYESGPGTSDDIAVLTLSTAFSPSAYIRSIALAPTGSTESEGASVRLTGFGRQNPSTISNGNLSSLTLGIQYSRECGGESDAVFICASSAAGSACNGDTGGPLTSTESSGPVLVGIMDTVESLSGGPCSAGAISGFVNVAAPEIRAFIEGSESPPQAPRGGHAEIEGVVRTGHGLTCIPGTWSNSPTFTYVFESSSNRAVLQAGASPTYQLSSTNVGENILCEVQASNAGGTGIGRTPGIGPIEEEKSSTPGSSSSGSSSPSTATPAATQEVAGFQAAAPPLIPDAQLAGIALEASLSGIVSVKVSCPAGESSCSGTVTLRTLNAVAASLAGAAKSKGSILTLATGAFTVAGGKVTTVKLHLSAKARLLLARSHVLRARAILVAHDLAGASHTTQIVVTLRAAGARRDKA
jgi:secreted trypsin-like serine protease